MTPLDIDQEANLQCSREQMRAQLADLNACLLDIDTRSLMFDPDDEYRTEVKLRLVVDNEKDKNHG